MTREIRELRTDEFKGMHITEALGKLHEYGLVPQPFTYKPNATVKLVDIDIEGYEVHYFLSFERWECEWSELVD